MAGGYQLHFGMLMVALFALVSVPPSSSTTTRRFHLTLGWKNVTRLCYTKPLLAMNDMYPGPTLHVHEGDNVEIKVTNTIAANTTIHWHGIRQMRTGWADGPAYVTQCPIAPGTSYTYKFTVIDQRGTLWWHAHVFWQRATVHGALVIHPRMPYPFKAPQAETPILLGEWWNSDIDAVEKEMMLYGGGPNVSDAYTINGLPGPLYPCSMKDTFIQKVDPGKTYMLRIINAGLNNEVFFAVANHTFTVVEIDAVYTKPFKTPAIMIGPGQTTNVLLTADQVSDSSGMFAISLTPYVTAPIFPLDNSTAIGFLRYNTRMTRKMEPQSLPHNPPTYNLPKKQDTAFATHFSNKLRSLASEEYPCRVPKTVDKHVVTTIGLQLQDCPENKTCLAYFGKRFLASMNNQSFVRPYKSILESYYKDLTNGVYSTNFPEKPPNHFDFSGVAAFTTNMNTEFGTRIMVVPYGTNFEIIFQNTGFLHHENHPIHVHGHNFFIVGKGFGNFDASKDPTSYNLVDPPERNTVAVPSGGWAAIRFKADNPGAWFIHCHLEEHTSWGLATAFIVQNGPYPSQSVLPPPDDLPAC